MKLYEIIGQLESCVMLEDGTAIDGSTGEFIDIEAIEALELERDVKIENIALWVKNLLSDAAQIKAEIDNLSKRKKALEGKAESLEGYLASVLSGQKFDTARVAISFRASESVQVVDDSKVPAEYVKVKTEVSVDKNALKKALKGGLEVEGVQLISKQNIQIK